MRGDISHAPNVPPSSLPPLVKIFLLLTLSPAISFTYHSHLSKLLWKQSRRRLLGFGVKLPQDCTLGDSRRKGRFYALQLAKHVRPWRDPAPKKTPYLPHQSSQVLFRKAEEEQLPPELKRRKDVGGCHLLQEMQKSWTSPCLLSPGRHDLTIMKIMRPM